MDKKTISIKAMVKENNINRPLTQAEKDKNTQREFKKGQKDYKKVYADKLRSPKWQKKRLEVFDLRGFKCEECGDEENQLAVHHRFYIKGREPWEYDNDVYQVLCHNCHKNKHPDIKLDEIEIQLIQLIREKQGIDAIDIVSLVQDYDVKKHGYFFTDIAGILCGNNDVVLNLLLDYFSMEAREIAYYSQVYDLEKKVKILENGTT